MKKRISAGAFTGILAQLAAGRIKKADYKNPQAAKPLVDVDFWRRVWDSNPRAQ